MNWRRAAIAAGVGIAALLVIFGTALVVFAMTFDLTSAFTFGGGPSIEEQLLWAFVLPAAVGIGAAFLAFILKAGRKRSILTSVFAFIAAGFVVITEIVPYNPLTENEIRIVMFVFLVVAVFSVLITVVRRMDIPDSKRKNILVSLAVSVFGGAIAFSMTPMEVSFFIALAAWILLPAFAALMIPDSP